MNPRRWWRAGRSGGCGAPQRPPLPQSPGGGSLLPAAGLRPAEPAGSDLLLLQLRHAPGGPQARLAPGRQRRRPVPGGGAALRRHHRRGRPAPGPRPFRRHRPAGAERRLWADRGADRPRHPGALRLHPPGPGGSAHRLRALADRRGPYPHPPGGERPLGGAGPAQRGHPQRQRHGAPLLPPELPLRGPAATASAGWWRPSVVGLTAMRLARAGRCWWIERPEDAASHGSFSTGSRR